MQYMGGKTRIAKQIAAVIDQYREPGQLVWDAFCGGLSTAVALSEKGPVLASDIHPALISMYRAIKNGWVPPEVVTKEEYESAKSLPDTDPLKAFCGFGCSFGGKYFGGYAKCTTGNSASSGRDKYSRNYPAACKKSLASCHLIRWFTCADFLTIRPRPTSAILYLDPPYKGTTLYASVDELDRSKFVKSVIEWSKFTTVFVSEYQFSIGDSLWTKNLFKPIAGGGDGGGRRATEKLFYIAKGSL